MEDQSAGLICTIYNDEEWEKELPIMNLIIFEKKGDITLEVRSW